MLIRVFLLLAVPLALPSLVEAQGRPRVIPGSSDPTRPQPMPPQIEPVARQLAYQRTRLAVETFPMVSHVRAGDFRADGALPFWTSIGAGTRVDYRISHRWSAVGEVTGSWAGSPVVMTTAEIGTRFRPYSMKDRVQPFVDLRASWALAYQRPFTGPGDRYDSSIALGGGQGFGAVAGAGLEYTLTHSWSAVTSGSLLVNRMSGGYLFEPDTRGFGMTTLRLIAGVRYTRTRAVTAGGTAR